MPGKGGRNSGSLGKYLGFAVPGTSNSFITFENFYLLFFPLRCLGKPGTPVQRGVYSLLHRLGVFQLCNIGAICSALAGGIVTALLLICRNADSSTGRRSREKPGLGRSPASSVLRSGHLSALGHLRSHPRTRILTKGLIRTRSAT